MGIAVSTSSAMFSSELSVRCLLFNVGTDCTELSSIDSPHLLADKYCMYVMMDMAFSVLMSSYDLISHIPHILLRVTVCRQCDAVAVAISSCHVMAYTRDFVADYILSNSPAACSQSATVGK